MENNNEQVLNNDIKVVKKRKIKPIILVIAILFIIILSILLIYKTTIDISDKYSDKFDYDFSEITINDDNYLKFLSYDKDNDPNTLFIDIPKLFFYDKVFDINEFKNEVFDKYNTKMNRIGFISNENVDNYIDYSIDCVYKDKIKFYLNGSIEYQMTEDNGFKLILRSMNIGKLPNFLYSNMLPYSIGDTIFEVKSIDYDLLREKVLLLSLINNIKADKNSVSFEYNYIENMDYIVYKIFGNTDIYLYDVLKEYMPTIMDSIINGNKDISYTPKKTQ